MSTRDRSRPEPREQITLLLQDWSKGNKQAGDLAMAIIYAELAWAAPASHGPRRVKPMRLEGLVKTFRSAETLADDGNQQ